jgi:hypothetical protein
MTLAPYGSILDLICLDLVLLGDRVEIGCHVATESRSGAKWRQSRDRVPRGDRVEIGCHVATESRSGATWRQGLDQVPSGDRVEIRCHLGFLKKDLLFFEFLFAFTEICAVLQKRFVFFEFLFTFTEIYAVFSKTISNGKRAHRNAAKKGKKRAVVYLG